MNIAVGKFGRSLSFNKDYRKTGHGDLAPMACIITLAKRYPEHNFYLVNASDVCRINCAMNDVSDNIIDLYRSAKLKEMSNKKFNKTPNNLCEWVWDNAKDIKFDFGIFFQGPDFQINTPYIYKKQTTECHRILEMTKNYCSAPIHFLNKSNTPYIIVNEDPRYIPSKTEDLFNDDICILSHINTVAKAQKRLGYLENSPKYREYTANYIYSGIERTSLLFLKKYDFRNYKDFVVDGKHYKKDGFMFMACNESPSRFKNVKDWVLDKFDDVKIYGAWEDKTIKGYEDRFENKPMVYLQDEMWRAKYTFVPGFYDTITNFVTIKIWEMCIYGILPFFDKAHYDTDNLLPIPDYLRCESPEDMKAKIDELERNEKKYQDLLNQMYDILKDDYFNGNYICSIFDPIFKSEDPSKLTIEDFRKNAEKITAKN